MPHSFRPAVGADTLKVCELSEHLDAPEAMVLGRELEAMLAGDEYTLVVSLQDLQTISAGGLNVLLAFGQKARAAKGDMRFFGASDNVARVLDLAGFNRYFKTDASEADAVKAFE